MIKKSTTALKQAVRETLRAARDCHNDKEIDYGTETVSPPPGRR